MVLLKDWYKYLISLIILVFVGLLLSYFSEIFSYVLISWVISMIGEPGLNFFLKKTKIDRYSWGKPFAAFLTLVVLFSMIGILLSYFIPILISQGVVLSKVDFESISLALQQPIDMVNAWLRSMGLEPGPSASDQLQKFLGDYFDPSRISSFFGDVLSKAGSLLIALFSIIFISFFFLKEKGLFSRMILAAVSTGSEPKVQAVINDISQLLSKYFGGLAIQMSILMMLIGSLLGLLGISNALLIAFFYGIVNIIPYLGPLIGAVFGCLLTISSNLELDFFQETIPLLVQVLMVFAVVKIVDDFVLQPYIFSRRMQAHPLEIFLVIMIGARMEGIIGMVLAIPVYTILRVIAKVFLSEIKLVRKITEDLKTSAVNSEDNQKS
ncbi:MAG: AI-2E family transporter [Saprospiraceae bacterium]|nr:AI-2E family transporter [Saprospiraceae bacterium]